MMTSGLVYFVPASLLCFVSNYLIPLLNCLISFLLFQCACVGDNTRAQVTFFLVILNEICF